MPYNICSAQAFSRRRQPSKPPLASKKTPHQEGIGVLLGFRVLGLGSTVQGLGSRVEGLRFRVWGYIGVILWLDCGYIRVLLGTKCVLYQVAEDLRWVALLY